MRSIKRSVTAFSLAAAMVVSSISFGGNLSTVEAAAKQNVITKATYNDGSTVKYSYNKKGLVTKSVSKNSYKTNASGEYDDELEDIVYNAEDVNTTVTTTYKYNKKNKISSKTVKTVTKTTFYDADKTTLAATGAKGTVTDTKTAVTKFTYNKKGLATQSVTTTTNTKSGSVTSTIKSSSLRNSNEEVIDANGNSSVLAGYNDRNADGTTNHEDTSANAYYYTGAIDAGAYTTTVTTTYTDNGDGTYKKAYSKTGKSTGAKEEPAASYYGEEWNDGVRTIVPLTKSEEKSEYGDYTYTVYKKADGTTFNGNSFSVVQSVAVSADSSASSSSSTNNEETITDKAVTTTKYTYDKKKRVKKAVATTVDTDAVNGSYSSASESKSSTNTSKEEDSRKKDTLTENTSVSTTTYKYDKKGRAKKVVVSDEGKVNRKETVSEAPIKKVSESARINSDGKVSWSEKNNKTYTLPNTYQTVTKTEVVDGKATTTTTHYGYSYDFDESDMSGENSGNTSAGKTTVTYYTNGGSKVETTSTDTEYYTTTKYTDDDKEVAGKVTRTQTGVTTTAYSFDEYSTKSGYINAGYKAKYVYTYDDGSSSESESDYSASSNYYEDGKYSKHDVDATIAIDAAKSSVTEGNFEKKEEDTLLAAPSKTTTTYAYDKNGNIKSAKASGTYTGVVTAKNEEYGNDLYEFNASNKLKEKKVAVTHKFTNKDAMENTVKKGTKNLTKVYTANTYNVDREKDSGSWIKKAAYTIKSKKASATKVAKKQQWNIQNSKGNILNGQIGLN